MFEQFAEWKRAISHILETALTGRETRYGEIHPLGGDVAGRLLAFAVSGKMIRGGLVCLGHGLADDSVPETALTVGAAVELFQSALLVHDDIMDRDELRRGGDTVYHQYVRMAGERDMSDPKHLGEALGICAGDIAFFMAFELLSTAEISPSSVARIVSTAAGELELVGVAQMADVYRGAEKWTDTSPANGLRDHGRTPTERTLNMYLYKTGRYTFSLPLSLGVMIAGGPEELRTLVERIGENLGVLFQIKDDEIGLFGDSSEIGKPVGSDIIEGKKTVYYTELFARADPALHRRLEQIFGNPDTGPKEIALIRERMESLGVVERVREIASAYVGEAERLIDDLERGSARTRARPSGRYGGMLRELLSYTMSRNR